jgi:hypothetical protein
MLYLFFLTTHPYSFTHPRAHFGFQNFQKVTVFKIFVKKPLPSDSGAYN